MGLGHTAKDYIFPFSWYGGKIAHLDFLLPSTFYRYPYEMTDDDHSELVAALRRVKAKVMVSGYRCELYDKIYSGWNRIDDEPYLSPLSKKPKQESIWLNYDTPPAPPHQLKML